MHAKIGQHYCTLTTYMDRVYGSPFLETTKGEKMTRRRGNGEGCLHHKANGSWRALVTLQGRQTEPYFQNSGRGAALDPANARAN